jgi:hypothetical protein
MAVWMVPPIVIPVFSIVILIFAAQIRRRALSFALATLLKTSRAELIESFAVRPVGTLNL